MENPKDVVKHEPRKSLIVLFVMGTISIVFGIILLIAMGGASTGMGGGAGWVMIVAGALAIGLYVYGRKSRRP